MKFNNTILGLLLFCCISQLQASEVQIAAASNLRYVLSELITEFDQQTGHHINVSYAASGTLTTQIQHGAPFEVFFSAAPSYIQRLTEDELIEGELVDFAQAQLVLFASAQSSLSLDVNLKGLKSALEHGQVNKVAIANPKHAPYGQVAQHLLEHAGLWQKMQSHLLIAENASQAIQFALTSQVDVSFVPYSYMLQPQISSKGRYVKLNATLPQQAVLIRGASATAKEFLAFIQTEQAKTILIKQGFIVQEKVS
ncbi:MAG: molybdate transport system substrate-binding protein [Methylophagaceae bacterium]|jgi:molybdate transport system substrate-binding protein